MPRPKKSTFAADIKRERDRLGLTQAEAAKLCGVSPRIWWKWETNDLGRMLKVTQEGVIARLKLAYPKDPTP